MVAADGAASTHLPTPVPSGGGAGGFSPFRIAHWIRYVTTTKPAASSARESPRSAITVGFGPAGSRGISAWTLTAPPSSWASRTRNARGAGGTAGFEGCEDDDGGETR